MGTLTEKATVRPNTSMNSTDMISTGWRPNLTSKFKIIICLWTLVNKSSCYASRLKKQLTSQQEYRTPSIQRWSPPIEKILQCGLSMPSHTPDSTEKTKKREMFCGKGCESKKAIIWGCDIFNKWTLIFTTSVWCSATQNKWNVRRVQSGTERLPDFSSSKTTWHDNPLTIAFT